MTTALHKSSSRNFQRIAVPVAIATLVVVVRVAAAFVLQQTMDSDAHAYFKMAQGLGERGELLDQFGQHAFYSAGYPLILTPFFTLFGSSVGVALMLNMLLALASAWLIFRITLEISENRMAGCVAAIGYAIWLPSIWNATIIAKENLSTPLMLALGLFTIFIARNGSSLRYGFIAGILWGAGLLTGGSVLLLCLGVAVALILLWQRHKQFSRAFRTGLSFIAGASILLAPWLYATDKMVGRPMLTTNAAFNLYLGNNPAANGHFVSMAETPLGKEWKKIRTGLGEAKAADVLQEEAVQWIKEHPGRAAELAALKLFYFWQPNIPDAKDFHASKAVVAIRLVEIIQYGLIVLFGFLAFRSRLIAGDAKWIIATMIAGFWLIHAVAYIIPRYRDPVIPLLLVMASIPATAWLQYRFPNWKWCNHGA